MVSEACWGCSVIAAVVRSSAANFSGSPALKAVAALAKLATTCVVGSEMLSECPSSQEKF